MRYGSTQWDLCTVETYNELIEKFHINEWSGFREYEELRQEYEELRQEYEELRQEYEELRQEYEELRPRFNILDGEQYSNKFESKERNNSKYHPCNKPIDILEKLIKVHSRENETVLDLFMGGGSTGVACVNTNRNFIGIELDENYFSIAKDRIDKRISEERRE